MTCLSINQFHALMLMLSCFHGCAVHSLSSKVKNISFCDYFFFLYFPQPPPCFPLHLDTLDWSVRAVTSRTSRPMTWWFAPGNRQTYEAQAVVQQKICPTMANALIRTWRSSPQTYKVIIKASRSVVLKSFFHDILICVN